MKTWQRCAELLTTKNLKRDLQNYKPPPSTCRVNKPSWCLFREEVGVFKENR